MPTALPRFSMPPGMCSNMGVVILDFREYEDAEMHARKAVRLYDAYRRSSTGSVVDDDDDENNNDEFDDRESHTQT